MKLTDLRMLLTGILTAPLFTSCIYPYTYYEEPVYEPQFIYEEQYTYCFDDQYSKEYENKPYNYVENFRCVEPVYLNLTVLREAVTVDFVSPKPIEKAGRLYGYAGHIFVVDQNNGIGIWELNYDNTTQIGYLSIPGVTNLAIRDDILYANSYMDLVKVDTDNEPTRLQNVFDYSIYDANALLPENTYFYQSDMNETNGVIIGYKDSDSVETVLF